MTELSRTLHEVAFYPPHPPRKASKEYERVHHHLVVDLDSPCWVCGVTHSKGGAMETHHDEIEWASASAFETHPEMLAKLVQDLSGKISTASPDALAEFLDSEGNLLVLCATHHRGPSEGIHSITYPVWKLQRYEYTPGAFQFVQQQPPKNPQAKG